MSFGCSLSDISFAIDGCKWLWDNCFNKNNSADEQYKQLEKDVKFLEGRLRNLHPALEHALQQHENPEVDGPDLERDLKNLIGDFRNTIHQCEELLSKHVSLKRNSAGFIENVIWAATSKDKVEMLRRTIQFHAQKIHLVMEPVNHNLLTTIDGKIDVLHGKIDIILRLFSIPTSLPEIPSWLALTLNETIFKNPPPNFSNVLQIPLKEGFDALCIHFRTSTFAFHDPETAEQTPEQYLNLLKCQWLVETLRRGTQFQRAHPASLYPRTIGQMEQRILKQYERGDIVRPLDKVLQSLNPTSFLIWPAEEAPKFKLPTDPNEGEELILGLSLPRTSRYEPDSLVIFKTGPTTLRIARRYPERSEDPYDNELFNVHYDKITPFYAITENSIQGLQVGEASRNSSISIHRANETGTRVYEIQGEKDIFNFQRAITEYQVVYHNTVDWVINHSGKPHMGRGQIQIWHWKPLSGHPTAAISPLSPTASVQSYPSQASGTSDTVIGKVLLGKTLSAISVSENLDTDSTICVTTPPHPVIIIYATDDQTYTYFHLELDFGLQIVPTSCECNRNPNVCTRIVIEKRQRRRSSERPFLIRRMSVHGKENLSDWNLAAFCQPRHPMFDNSKIMQRMERSRYLELKFASVGQKFDFVKKFDRAIKLRDEAELEKNTILTTADFLGERLGVPPKAKKLSKPKSNRSSIASTSRTTPASPPILQPIRSFSNLTMNEPTDQTFELSGSRASEMSAISGF
ncbi:hypothetical protein N431DRAFT_18684 [Stipitochalara longipes BDJ]|nr:hypothetical protein N431DRAFT_18684 [Stipitochalara longipes BDJ]